MYDKNRIRKLLDTELNEINEVREEDVVLKRDEVMAMLTNIEMNNRQKAGWQSFVTRSLKKKIKVEEEKPVLPEHTQVISHLKNVLAYTDYITGIGCVMPCFNCESTGYTDHRPRDGRCYWCNKEGHKPDLFVKFEVKIANPLQITWWQRALKKGMDELGMIGKHLNEVDKAEARELWFSAREEWHRLESCKMKVEG